VGEWGGLIESVGGEMCVCVCGCVCVCVCVYIYIYIYIYIYKHTFLTIWRRWLGKRINMGQQ
jgi:hypothetical protein